MKRPRFFLAGLFLAACACTSAFGDPPVANPKVWLHAGQGVVTDENGGIERWEDQSGQGNHFLQATEAKRPTLAADGFVKGDYTLSKLPRTINGNTTWAVSLGTDFIVDEEVSVSHLAAFDHLRDGFSNDITVQLWKRSDGGTPATYQDDGGELILEQLTFTPGDPGTLDGPYRWKALPAPRVLAPGSYTLVCWGFVGTDQYYSSSNNAKESPGSGVRWGPISRYANAAAQWPVNLYSQSLEYFAGAMNMRFQKIGETPAALPAVRFDGVDDGLQGIPAMNFDRPSTVFAVFERESGESGYVLQNSSGDGGGNWWIRNDGFYANGWVRNRDLEWGRTHVATMLGGTGTTRAWQGFSDVTDENTLGTSKPGRLALGGGSGQQNDPIPVKIAEVLVYDRQLSDGEIWQVQSWLGGRYGVYEATAQTPSISPPGHMGAGDVTVTLAAGDAGAQIRYTMDGSEPTVASALYSAPFTASRGTEVKARAFLAGAAASGVAAQYYGDAAASGLPVGGTLLWLRGDRGVATDHHGKVTRWQDLTGNGNDMVQGTEWQRPRRVNAFPVGGGVAIKSLYGDSGANTHSGTLGADFEVTQPVVIEELGAFDHLGDGFGGAVTVQLWSRNHQGTLQSPEDDTAGSLLAEAEFTSAEPGTLAGGTRFKAIAPVTLPPGSYSILAWGFTGSNFYRNSSDGSWQTDGLGFVNNSRYSSSNGTWPTTMDSHPVKYNGVGNFRYRLASGSVVSRPVIGFDGVDDGLAALPTSNIGRPSTVYVAFERSSNGRILQGHSSTQWFIRHDGGYASNWVANLSFPALTPVLAGMTNGPAETRLYRDGTDITVNPGVQTNPGRLAVGGGSGYSNEPSRSQVAEVLAFDRVLSEAERWQVEDYLARRYKSELPELPPVAISPASHHGSGPVEVTLAQGVPGAQIRYTTDGSEPGEGSTLYAGSFSVPRGTTVKARVFLAGAVPGAVSVAYYGGEAEDLPVAGAKMWLRADAGVETDASGGVSRWRDLTGNGNDMAQNIAGKRPVLGSPASLTSAVDVPDIEGTSTYAGSLGEDFVVDEEIVVSHLGVFDHRRDGFAGTVRVELWSRNDNGTPMTQYDDGPGEKLAEAVFDSADPGVLDGVGRFKTLASPVTLPPGSYTVYAWGYTGQDRYNEGSRGSRALDDPRFRFIGVSRFTGTGGAWPGSLDTAALDYNGAANFKVVPAVESDPFPPAVVFDGADDGLHGVEAMNFARPSTVVAVFERTRNESGYVLQNSGGGNWWIRNDGIYANGWVRNENFDIHRRYLAVVSNGAGFTRFVRNGDDVTVDASLSGANPGRLALGGGSGQQNDPIPVRVSELVVFDRVLDDGELWELQTHLAARHRVYSPYVATPSISPPPGYGTGDVEVSLSVATPGAEIRYTLDGTEPAADSALYENPLSVARGVTVKARAFLAGAVPGGVAQAFYGNAAAHPLPVANPVLWLQAGQGVETRGDGSVLRWKDLSGNGHAMLSSSPEQSPRLLAGAFGGALKTAVVVPEGASAETNYAGFLGSDFIVEEPVEVTHLGAFDHNGDGFAGTITVRIHQVNDNGTPDNANDDSSAGVLATAEFTPGQPGVLDGSTRFIELDEPLALAPGRYLVESWGWTGGNRYRGSDVWDETIGEGISYPGIGRFHTSQASLFPGSRANDNRYLAAGNFKFRKPGASGPAGPAVRFDGINDGLLGPANLTIGRPSTVFMVFNQLGGADGRLIQGANNNFLLGPHVNTTDGMYADGWVAQHTIRRNLPSQVVGVMRNGDTRYFYNGVDLTQDANPNGVLGRVALGGAEGQNNQPVNADLVELIIYDRVLSPAERQQVSAALAGRHDLPVEKVLPPLVSPDGGYFSSGRTVSLSHPLPGATIRYTTDGSEPTESSTLYASPFPVSSSGTVKARAFAAGYAASEVEEGVFIIDPAATEIPQRQSLQLWLRAGVGTELESDAVARWRDLSGQGKDAAQSVVASRPALDPAAIGGAAGIVFDGNNDFLQMPEGFADFSQGLTAIFVVRPEAVGNWQRFLCLGRGPNNANLFFGRRATSADFTYVNAVHAPDALQNATNAIYTVSHQPDGRAKIFHNGSLVAELASLSLPSNIVRTVNYIGESNWTGDANFNGAISEILLYNAALGDLERETLETAVRGIYGISTSATGTVAFSPDPSQLYPSGVNVTLQSVTPDARIHYTLDGSVPDESSPLYAAPIALANSARIRARAFADGFNASQFSEATYLIGLPPSSGDGLLATYHDNIDFTGPSLTRVDPTVNFSWGQPDPAIQSTTFSVRWTGKVMARFSEDYTFYPASDDGQRLWVDLNGDGDFDDETERLVNDWIDHGETERATTPVPLVAGQLYNIKMEMYNNAGGSAARLRWSSFSEPKAIIPQSQLFSNATYSQTVATPVISPAGGTYNAAAQVTISTATPASTIYYTTDGSEPVATSPVYGGPFEVGASATVRARAYKAGFNPSGVATVNYVIDAQPPLIGAFDWNGEPIENGETFTAKGTLSATATDNQGIARAEFYYRPAGTGTTVLIGTDTSPANGLTASWDIAAIPDGNYTVMVRVYDTTGIWSESSRDISVTLAPPPAPQITLPASGITVQDPVVGLRVETIPGANVRIHRDGVFLFAGYANTLGRFDYQVPLPTGTSLFKATVQNRAGQSPDSNVVSVTRVREFPQLALAFGEETVMEGSSVTGTVSIPAAEAADLTVHIATNKASRFEAVPPLVIPAGSTSAPFILTPRQNSLIELLTPVLVTASATEHRSGTMEIYLGDDDYPDITLELDQTSVSEKHGSVVGTVRRAFATDRSLRVNIVNSKPSEASSPAFVDIPAGQTSKTFTIVIIDDDVADGNQFATLRGEVAVSGVVVAATPEVTLEVRDDEGALLALELSKPFLAEGNSLNGTVRRSGASNAAALTVNLTSTPAGQLSIPASVVIPAGQNEAPFVVSAPSDPAVNGTRALTVRAAAATYADALVPLTLSDQGLPELAVTSLSAPAQAQTETYMAVGYRIENYGNAPAVGPFAERIFLSSDPSPGPDDIVVRQIDQTGETAPGAGYGRNVTVLAPRNAGTYYLIVTVDPGNSVVELDETNNTTVLIQPIEVRPAYSAVVQTAPEIVPANTPIVFTGSATREGGQPAAYSMINIHIGLNGTNRIISAVTNSIGQFTVTWTPLRNEGGIYTIGASHPGTTSAPVQDTFEILTLGFDAPGSVVMHEAETVAAQAVLRNPNGRPLTGISLAVGETPAGLTITPQLPATTLAAGEEMAVPIAISAAAGFSGQGSFPLTVQTAEGVVMQALLHVRIELLKPVLTLNPASLNSSALRGVAKSESIVLTNTGGLETGPIQVLLPDIPWLSLASANPMPSIPPGGTAALSLNIAPDVEAPLTLFTGNLAINPANGGSKSLPYRVRVVSDLKGDLEIEVVDELFFFTAEAPKLAGAQVTVRDAISSAQIATTITGTNGLATFPNLNEGWYRVEVNAPEHDSFSGNYYVNAGDANRHQIFISKQLVKYTWKVEEVEIEDEYRVTIETTFETNVPAPVVTATPSNIDVGDLLGLGQVKIVNITLENHGFIAAQESKFRFSEHPFYEFTPLVTNIGTIPAKSSLVVPVMITRKGVFGDDGEIVTLRGERLPLAKSGVPCGAGGAVDYSYPCGPHLVDKVVAIAMSGVQGNCGGGGSGGGGGGGFIGGGFYGGFGGGGGGGGGGSSGSSMSFASPDPCLNECLLKATLDCLVGFTPAGCPYAVANCVASEGDLLTCTGAAFCWAGPWVNGGFCILSYINCYRQFGGGAGGGGGGPGAMAKDDPPGYILPAEVRAFAPEVAGAWERVETVFAMQEAIFGSKAIVLLQKEPGMEEVLAEFSTATGPGSPAGRTIDGNESLNIQALALSHEIDWEILSPAIARWNRTVTYNGQGIFDLADVPGGESTDFIARDVIRAKADALVAAFDESRAMGFVDPVQELLADYNALRQDLEGGQGGACARVKIQLSHSVTMTRTAFRATLELENEREEEISGVGFDLQVRDAFGLPAEDLFNIQVTRLEGLDAIDGNGQLGSKGIGTIQWTLIPRDTAALESPVEYTVGGVITYTQGTTTFNIPVENVPITVRPDAALSLKYFHQRDVVSDDPWTDPIEPAQPFKLAVLVENHGFGDARNLKIVSSQPEIVDNEKGLFIDFKVIGTEVDGQPLSPSLAADFGTVAPGQRKIATWLLTSTLQGLFTDYKATFEHVTGLGDPRISLLKEVGIHEMIRMVRDQRDGADSAPDFLTNDVADANDYPDTIHYSHGGSDQVTVKETGTFSAAPTVAAPSITLNTGAFGGWAYIRLPDPAMGNFRLVSVTRADGRVLPLDFNTWQSDRTFIGGGRRPRYEHIVHLVDHDSAGAYTLLYAPMDAPDTTPPASSVAALPPLSPAAIPVFWSGSDDRGVASYTVFVSVNGGPFAPWKTNTQATGAIYEGSPATEYAFYSVAKDHAGNVESKAAAPEAGTAVGAINQPPVLSPIGNRSVNKGEIFTVQAAATDPDGTNGDIRYAIVTSQPGIVIHPVTGVIGWTTSETDGGKTVPVTVIATDGGVPSATAQTAFQISVIDVNRPPEISPVGPQTLEQGGVLIVDVDATDGDFPAQTLTFSLAEAPAGATIHPATGVIQWSPLPEQAGSSHLFTVTVTDNGTPAQSASTSFPVLVVSQADLPPVFTKVPVVLWLKGKTYSLTVAASDPDGDPVALSANLATVPGATFADQGGGNGRLDWASIAAEPGVYQVPVTATANGASGHATLRIQVAEDELYWSWVKETFGELPEGFDLALLGMDADPDGDGRENIHEMALLTNPLQPDSVPLAIRAQFMDPFSLINLGLHQRVGAEAYVNLGIERSGNLMDAWEPVPPADWSVFIDPDGDDDSLPHTREVDFRIFEYHPAGIPDKRFYRVKSTRK